MIIIKRRDKPFHEALEIATPQDSTILSLHYVQMLCDIVRQLQCI